jgi:hypothetical protein
MTVKEAGLRFAALPRAKGAHHQIEGNADHALP